MGQLGGLGPYSSLASAGRVSDKQCRPVLPRSVFVLNFPALRVFSGVLVLVLAGVLVFGVACSDSDDDSAPELDDPNAVGTELVNEYLTLLQQKDADGLEDFLSDAFIIQRANGSSSEKQAYLQNTPEI